MLLQKLSSRGLLSAADIRSPAGEKLLQIAFHAAADSVLASLETAWQDFASARLAGFSEEERDQYAQLTQRIQDNIRDVLA